MQKAQKRQQAHADSLVVGDRVAMSALWLKSISAGYDLAKLRGTLVQIGGLLPDGFLNSEGEDIGGEPISDRFAVVQWGKGPAELVAKFNLARVGGLAFAEAPSFEKPLI